MSDPAIKLFGKTIPLLEISSPSTSSSDGSRDNHDCSVDHRQPSCGSLSGLEGDTIKETGERKQDTEEIMDDATPAMAADLPCPDAPYTTSAMEKEAVAKSSNSEDQNESNSISEKAPKKPDKLLPCPRCNSMDTKFCYYNNYNVNQPRHFCKNCQRYWTNGGTMRNVPVGAGRRKNKSSSSQFRHITVTDPLHPTVLTFGPEVSLHESMADVLTIADKSMRNEGKRGDDTSPGTSAEITFNDEGEMKNIRGFLPCFPAYISPSGFCPPGFVFSAAPYWGCRMPAFYGGPYLVPPVPLSPSGSSGPNSPTLGKHSREFPDGEEDDPTKGSAKTQILIPKTLRIDDPEEAAKSSIWTTLGIKNEKPELIGGRLLFKPFDAKGGPKNPTPETCPVLQANPAALSRSLNFHESS